MEDSQELLKEKSILIIAFAIIQAIFIAIIVSLASLFMHNEKISSVDYERQSKIEIENIKSMLPDATQDYLNILSQKIAETVELNTQNFDISESKAIVRDGTFKMTKLDKDNVSFYSMIIDIPNLKQSYQIYDHYMSDSEPANRMYVLCLDQKSDIIYPNFGCKDNYPPNMRNNIVASYLGYFNFDYFSTYLDPDDPGTIIISPSVTYDNDAATKSRYIEEVKAAIDSLGISSDHYQYYVRTAADVNYHNPS